jgi:hypothetical protein
MKNCGKQLGPYLWQLWKESLAASAAILAFFAFLDVAFAYFLHYEHHVQSVVSQLSLWLPLSIFALTTVPFVTFYVTQCMALKCTERRRHNIGLGLFIPAFIGTIIWFIAMEKWSPQGIWMWIEALVLLVLASAGWSMFLQRQPRQPEEPLSKAQETEEVPSTPKPERAKIISPAALRDIIRALNDWIFEWWKMWKNILALLATISALSYTLADLIFHFDTTQIGAFVAKYSELALIMFGGLSIITLITYCIKIVRRNKRSSCKTK